MNYEKEKGLVGIISYTVGQFCFIILKLSSLKRSII